MYRLNFDNEGNICSVQRLTDMASIPCVEANIDYQEYLEWLAQGNTPEGADPEPTE